MRRSRVDDEIDRLKASLSAAHARREELWKRAERAESELAAAQVERDRLQAMVPRLEWSEGDAEDYKLSLHIGGLDFGLLSARYQSGAWHVWIKRYHYDLTREAAEKLVADHIATLDLSCPLPDFPFGASDAS